MTRNTNLDHLCWVYDNNKITIEGRTALAFSEDVGWQGISIGMETFGASAPMKALLKKFGFTVENVLQKTRMIWRNPPSI